jgi:hypothetical protein
VTKPTVAFRYFAKDPKNGCKIKYKKDARFTVLTASLLNIQFLRASYAVEIGK